MDLRPYDAYDLPGEGRELWQFRALKKLGKELDPAAFDVIKDTIQSLACDQILAADRALARAEAWMYPGEAGKRVADYMVKSADSD